MNTCKKYDREEHFRKAVRSTFQFDDATRKLIGMANWDLYYGPSGGGLDDECDVDDCDVVDCEDPTHRYPGFEKACKLVSKALDDLDVNEVWFDTQSDCVETSEPEWCDGCNDEECVGQRSEDYVHYSRADVLRALIGELAEYV